MENLIAEIRTLMACGMMTAAEAEAVVARLEDAL